MLRSDKERVVAELTERLRTANALIVADYRGLTNAQLERLRDELVKHGARFSVVKNTLTRIAAEAAGADALLAMLEGPSAIAFVETDGDPVAVAKALGNVVRDTRILAVRGGVLEGRSMSSAEVEDLATLPPLEVLRGQVLGAIIAPLNAIAALVNAPLQDLYGLIDARIEQLGGEAADVGDSAGADSPAADAGGEVSGSEPETASADAPEVPAGEEEAVEAPSDAEPESAQQSGA